MKLTHPLLAIIYLIAVISGCKNAPSERQSEIKKTLHFDFPEKSDSLPLKATEITGLYAHLQVIDTFLFCITFRDTCLLDVYSTRSKKHLLNCLKRGAKAGECLGIAAIMPTDRKETFWVYDITLGKLIKLSLSKLANRDVIPIIQEYVLTDSARNVKSPEWINDSLFIGTSYLFNDARAVYFTPSSKIVKKIGEYPLPDQSWPLDKPNGKLSLLATIYSARLTANKANKKIAIAYTKSDRIDFFQSDSLFAIVRGPELFAPILNFKIAKTYINAIETKKTITAYNDLTSDENSVYALYKGKEGGKYSGTKYLVFDWNGKLKKMYRLKDGFGSLINCSVDGVRTVFALNERDKKIYTCNLNNE